MAIGQLPTDSLNAGASPLRGVAGLRAHTVRSAAGPALALTSWATRRSDRGVRLPSFGRRRGSVAACQFADDR